MTARLRIRDIALALMLSLLLHVVLSAAAGRRPPPVSIDGGAPAAMAALGNDFADFTAGTETPEEANEELIEPLPPTTLQATDPAAATSEPEPPAKLQATDVAAATNAPEPPGQPLAASVDVTEPAPVTGVELLPGSDVNVAVPATGVLAPAEPTELVTALPEGPTPEERRAAEKRAQAERERKAREREKAQRAERAKREEQRRAQRRNADRNARAGQADGQRGARSASSGNRSGRNTRAGNAAAANYPGRVYAKIRRTKQRSVRGSGTAHVGFSVTSSGGLGSVRIARSSGNAVVDRAAMAHIRRAAPFPRPPAGARRTFVIPVRVR